MSTRRPNSVAKGARTISEADVAGQEPIGSPQMAVFYADLQGEFGACNAEFTRLFSYTSQDLIGREFGALLSRIKPTGLAAIS